MQDVLRLTAVVLDSSVECLDISGNTSLLPGIPPLPKSILDLWPQTSHFNHKIDGHVATLLDGDRPVRVFAVIDQDHPLYAQNSTYDVTSLGKPNDDTWYIIPPSLGGQSVPWNLRPAHNNNKGKVFGNLMFSRYVELMIHLWLDGMPPGSAIVKYEVSLNYKSVEYPERPDDFIYLIQFCALPSARPTRNIYPALKKMADGLKTYAEQNVVQLEYMYNLPANWIFEPAVEPTEFVNVPGFTNNDGFEHVGISSLHDCLTGEDIAGGIPSEFFNVDGFINNDRVEHVRISSLHDFLTGKDIAGGIPDETEPDFTGKPKTILKLAADNSIAAEGEALSEYGLLEPIQQDTEIARKKYESWLFLRIMIKQWLNAMPACTDPFVIFQISEQNTDKLCFAAKFLAAVASPELFFEKICVILPMTATEWCSYVDSNVLGTFDQRWRDLAVPAGFSSPNSATWGDVGLPTEGQNGPSSDQELANAEPARLPTVTSWIDNNPILDSVPVVGGAMEALRGINDITNESYEEGIIKICRGLQGIYFDVQYLGITLIPQQGIRPLIVATRFATLFAERAAPNVFL